MKPALALSLAIACSAATAEDCPSAPAVSRPAAAPRSTAKPARHARAAVKPRHPYRRAAAKRQRPAVTAVLQCDRLPALPPLSTMPGGGEPSPGIAPDLPPSHSTPPGTFAGRSAPSVETLVGPGLLPASSWVWYSAVPVPYLLAPAPLPAVPEPAPWGLLAAGLGIVAWRVGRRR